MTGRARWVVFGCFICQLALGYGYVFGPLLTDITGDLGLTRTAFGSARVGTTAAMALASPLFGWLVVRVGARPVLVGSSLLILVTYGWLSRIESLADLYVGYALVGLVTTGLGDVTIGAVVSQWVVRARGLALGIVYTGSNFAAIIFVQVATWLAIHQSWRTALLTIGIAGAALILPFAALAVRDRRPGDPLPAPELASVGAPDRSGKVGSDGEEACMTGVEALRTRSFWILFFALFSFFFYFIAILDLFVVFLTDAGIDRQDAATYFSAAVGMGLLSKVAMGVFADRLSARPAFILNFGLLALSSLILLVLPSAGFLQAFVVVFGFSYAARDVVYPMMIAECFGVRYLAPIYGNLMTVLLPASAGPAFAHWCFDRFGTYDTAFEVFAVMNVAIFGSLFFLRREGGR